MFRLQRLVSFLLAVKHWAGTVKADTVGYYLTSNSIVTYTCPSSAQFQSEGTFSDNPYTFARCDDGSPEERWYATSCEDNNVHWANEGPDFGGGGESDCSPHQCITVKIFDSYNSGDGSGLRHLVGCEDSLKVPSGIRTFFKETLTDYITTSPPTSTSIEPTSTTSVVSDDDSAPETLTPAGGGSGGGSNALSSGALAGIVIGSVAAGGLFVGLCLCVYHMGRRSRRNETNPEPHRNSILATTDSKGYPPTSAMARAELAAGTQPDPQPYEIDSARD